MTCLRGELEYRPRCATVAPLVNAWGFGFKEGNGVDAATIDSLQALVGMHRVTLADGHISKEDERIMLDFSAIAKGYAGQVAPGGFNGAIQMLVGVSKDGKILGVAVISQTETAGLGAIAGADNDAGQEFRDQYIGLTGLLAVDKDGGEIQSITGATVTSRAVTKGINAALDCVANMG